MGKGQDQIRTSLAVIEDNQLYQNSLTGIRITGSIPMRISACNINSNGRSGIALEKGANIVTTNCNFFQNWRTGININGASRAVVDNSRIYENRRAGVRIETGKAGKGRVPEVKIAGSRIYGNSTAGIRSIPDPEDEVDLVVVTNDIYKNNRGGVRVRNRTRLTARANKVYENWAAGFISHVSDVPPQLNIYQNSVSFNQGPGIHVLNGVSGSIGIRNNWVFDNYLSGILCGLWSEPDIHLLDIEIINNTIVSNGSSGEGAGIRNDSDGRAVIMNNIVAYNYETGIRTKDCRDDYYNLLFANGDVGTCCDEAESSPYWIERFQFGGCQGRGKGDLIADPLFADPDNYDFSVQDDSPAIDHGNNMHIYDDTSFPPSKGTTRNDMGATGGPYATN